MKPPSVSRVATAAAARAKPYLLPLVASSLLAYVTIGKVLEDAGRPAMPLDDSFIHLVYARRFAEGHPFSFGLGDGPSSGATSFLWPLVLAPFWLLGLRGLDTIWAAWALGTLLHAAVALETKRLVEPIAGKGAAVGAALMCLGFGAFAWFAWSGMETIAFAWAITRTVRVASEHAERPTGERTRAAALGLAAMGAACPLLRPEGGLFALAAAAVLAAYPFATASGRTPLARALAARAPALLPLAGIALVPLLNLALTGHARSSTAMVKWAVGNPYYPTDRLVAFLKGNVGMLAGELLGGGPFTAIFLPEHTNVVLGAGAVAAVAIATRRERRVRALLGLLLAFGTVLTATFLTILWNRVRYIWPFAPGWFFLVACLGAELEALATRRRKDLAFVAALVTGLGAGALATKLPWALADLANSARAIDRQQVTLGERARLELPEDARIGVNDTGAIAYVSERRTFDVVGLTTEGEARYWVAGAGSRFEHYERMQPAARPTHFIVYPQWMACSPVLGRRLFEATVTDQSILGGATKVAYEARYDVLGRAELPVRAPVSRLVDQLDVADLESEAAHGYALLDATDQENLVTSFWDDEGRELADGGRHQRRRDAFRLDLPEGRPARLVARLGADEPARLLVAIDGVEVGALEVPSSPWEELELAIPAERGGVGRTITIAAEGAGRFTSLHYWAYEE